MIYFNLIYYDSSSGELKRREINDKITALSTLRKELEDDVFSAYAGKFWVEIYDQEIAELMFARKYILNAYLEILLDGVHLYIGRIDPGESSWNGETNVLKLTAISDVKFFIDRLKNEFWSAPADAMNLTIAQALAQKFYSVDTGGEDIAYIDRRWQRAEELLWNKYINEMKSQKSSSVNRMKLCSFYDLLVETFKFLGWIGWMEVKSVYILPFEFDIYALPPIRWQRITPLVLYTFKARPRDYFYWNNDTAKATFDDALSYEETFRSKTYQYVTFLTQEVVSQNPYIIREYSAIYDVLNNLVYATWDENFEDVVNDLGNDLLLDLRPEFPVYNESLSPKDAFDITAYIEPKRKINFMSDLPVHSKGVAPDLDYIIKVYRDLFDARLLYKFKEHGIVNISPLDKVYILNKPAYVNAVEFNFEENTTEIEAFELSENRTMDL